MIELWWPKDRCNLGVVADSHCASRFRKKAEEAAAPIEPVTSSARIMNSLGDGQLKSTSAGKRPYLPGQ
jgi:hypothetical protein